MLRKLLIVFLMLGVLLSLSGAVCAKESERTTEDSKTISDDLRAELNVTDSDVVLRVYNVDIFSLADYQDITSFLMNGYVLEVLYAVKTSDNTYKYLTKREGKFETLAFHWQNDNAVKMCETGAAAAYIAPDVVVYNTYCLSAAAAHKGTAIYYTTNKGDYVYFRHHNIGERLFPAEAFRAYLKAIHEELLKLPPDSMGGVDFSRVWDLSPYDFKADTFNLNAKIPVPNQANSGNAKTTGWVIAAVGSCLLIAAIAGGFVYWRKRSSVLE